MRIDVNAILDAREQAQVFVLDAHQLENREQRVAAFLVQGTARLLAVKFATALVEQLRKRSISEPCIMHFRLATHGSIKRANCHPFKINDVCFAHNGILSVRPMGDRTDSETAFIRYLYPYIEQYGLYSHEAEKMVGNIIESSKFAFMQGEDVRLFGRFEEFNGCYCSNLRFTYLIPGLHRFGF